MFIVLQMERSLRQGALGRLADRLMRTKIIHKNHEVMGGGYKLLQWQSGSRPNWEQLEAACSRYRNRVLFPEGLILPEALKIETPLLPNFKRAVLVNTACEIATRSRLPLYRRVLGLIDENGSMVDELPLLLRYYSCIMVASRATELYAIAGARIMHELGAPVLVGCEPKGLGECMLVISEGSLKSEKLRAPLLCPGSAVGSSLCIGSLEITPPEDVSAACPEDISLQDFAGSLYEFSAVRDYNLVANQMLCNYRLANLTEVVRAVCDNENRR